VEKDKKVYLTIHGHFYQPPRENPWLEAIEVQPSAYPCRDWNERVSLECYTPNASAKIVTHDNRIMDIVNNYSYISFNFGPTLLSWLEKFSPYSYSRIIQADIDSVSAHNGHGNAIAQVYNHIIMPLANKNDKYTQVLWGIRDFQKRFGRNPEGMWLAETACDDETLEVLVKCGIKFTILSPFQAKRVRRIGSNDWQDAGWGNIDPARAYRYYLKSDRSKHIDLFFYDGAISKSAAFDNLLTDGNKFIERLKEGISAQRDYNQLVNIATDGESYGHHTKFGDMALAYVLKARAKDEGFIMTNYANYLELEPPVFEADIKDVSSWSCSHGVSRWADNCGCSTGAAPGWNQKWRRPLRDALDYLRDELIKIFEEHGSKYFKDIWKARNDYIDVILDRNKSSVKAFLTKHQKYRLNSEETVEALKLMEIQRQALLMYTSCGWFFAEISGIETVQIMKYALRAMELARSFSDKDLETNFKEILSKAESNIRGFGTGKDVFERFVKPSSVSVQQIAALWAASSNFSHFGEKSSIYCYNIKNHYYKHVSKGASSLAAGRIEIQSAVTLEKFDLLFASLHFPEGDFHCAVKNYDESENFQDLVKKLADTYLNQPVTETIRLLDIIFGSRYCTLKDLPAEDRKNIIMHSLQDKFEKFSNTYRNIYTEGKSSVQQLINLGIEIPEAYKLAARYTLSQDFNELIVNAAGIDEQTILKASDIINEAAVLKIQINKESADKIFSEEIKKTIYSFVKDFSMNRLNKIIKMFEYASRLQLKVDITEAQNLYFKKIYMQFTDFLDSVLKTEKNLEDAREFLFSILVLGEYLNINTDFYKSNILKLTAPKIEIPH